MITLSHIRGAGEYLPERYVFTPCLQSDALSALTGGTVLLKADGWLIPQQKQVVTDTTGD